VSGILLWAASTAYGVLFGKEPLDECTEARTLLLERKLRDGGEGNSVHLHSGSGLPVYPSVAAWIAAMLANKSFALGDAVEYENLKIAFVWMGFAIMAVISRGAWTSMPSQHTCSTGTGWCGAIWGRP